MLAYIGRRALLAVFTVWAISVLSFVIIQLPPGDYVTSYIAQMASMGSVVWILPGVTIDNKRSVLFIVKLPWHGPPRQAAGKTC